MRSIARQAALGITSAIVMLAAAGAADAKCTRLGFTVNDYGKDGPTKDAKALLDKYIADWAKQKGIAKYSTGKKTVNCELFIDVGLFDEHTCRAEASVCWGDDAKEEKSAANKPVEKTADKPKKTTKKKAEKKEE